jgi:hypothetical protein
MRAGQHLKGKEFPYKFLEAVNAAYKAKCLVSVFPNGK